ncbi:MAG: rhomboid family intramembrane serine protease [bacterium]|nr:rhomboid family intramembrane serine protease [bacterium]
MFFLPLKAVSKLLSYRFPWAVVTIILINIAVYLIYNLKLIPGFNIETLIYRPTDRLGGNYQTLITAMFTHASFMHIFSNMFFLWLFGSRLERMVGIWRFVLIYFVSGIMSTLAFDLASGGQFLGLLGASGAISGAMGAYMIILPKDDIKFFTWLFIRYYVFQLPAWIAVGYYLVVNILSVSSARSSGVAYLAHVSGIIFGMFLALILLLLARGRNRIFGKVVFVNVGDGTREYLNKEFFKRKWNVVSLTSVDEFHSYIAKFPINGIVVDYGLAGMMGEDFFSALVEDKKSGSVPIIILADHPTYKYWIEEHLGKQYQYISGKNVPQSEIVSHLINLEKGGLMKSDGPAPGAIHGMPSIPEEFRLA